MDEYLQNVKMLHSHMNDVEDQAAKISVEEQSQIRSIHSMETDLESAKSEVKSLRHEAERMIGAKNKICSEIVDNFKVINSLESETSSLTKTLELIQQERLSISFQVTERRAYYAKIAEELHAKFEAQQAWINSHNPGTEVGVYRMVEGKTFEKQDANKGVDSGYAFIQGNATSDIHLVSNSLETNETYKALTKKLESAIAKLAEITERNSNLVSECSKVEESIRQLECRINDYPPEVRAMDVKTLEDEHKALLSDKVGETEFLQTLRCQVEQLKGISQVIKCACGEEYKVEMATCT